MAALLAATMAPGFGAGPYVDRLYRGPTGTPARVPSYRDRTRNVLRGYYSRYSHVLSEMRVQHPATDRKRERKQIAKDLARKRRAGTMHLQRDAARRDSREGRLKVPRHYKALSQALRRDDIVENIQQAQQAFAAGVMA